VPIIKSSAGGSGQSKSGQITEIRVPDRVLSSTSAQEMANPPRFPTLKKS
jgi:hypothetical protein